MSVSPEGSSRGYHSPRRLAAARETRARIRDAAGRLFLADGYAPTSIRTIAKAAGVAEKTVYLQFANKPALLKEVVETAIVGDDQKIAAHDRPWFREILADPDPAAKIRLLVGATAALHERTGAYFMMARGAAAVDAEAADLWAYGKRGHRTDMTLLAESFEAAGMLPPGRDARWAMTVLYALVGPETWHLLRVELGADPAAYEEWLHATLENTFDVDRR
ncbi:MAG: TetR family transcriptional regulator [Nocardioides sp.]